jgi:uncharacterized Zn finger protein
VALECSCGSKNTHEVLIHQMSLNYITTILKCFSCGTLWQYRSNSRAVKGITEYYPSSNPPRIDCRYFTVWDIVNSDQKRWA